MGLEVTAKAKPVHQIEVVVLDSAATYQSGKLVKCCMKCWHGQFRHRYPIRDVRLPRLVMPDIRQNRCLQGWKRGYRWSQSRIAREIL